jgi:hypothetical protein
MQALEEVGSDHLPNYLLGLSLPDIAYSATLSRLLDLIIEQ